MNINDYSTKVKNLADILASIGAPIDDDTTRNFGFCNCRMQLQIYVVA